LTQLSRLFRLTLVVHFGSSATGRARDDSDYDLAVWTTTPPRRRSLDWFGRLGAALDRALRPGRELDLVLLNGADSLLLFHVANRGRPLYERSPGVFAQFQSYAARCYDDDAPRRVALDNWLEAQLG
jgi:predicted nucleotidyltransferase